MTEREHALLTSCARSLIDDGGARRIEGLVGQGIDWDFFVREACHHRVVPLAWRSLSRRVADHVPRPIAEDLVVRCAAIARRNLYLTARLGEIVTRLASDGVRVLAYKGPVGAVQAYGNLSLRQFGDLDILVAPSDYARTRALLLECGFSEATDWGWECSFDDAAQSVRVDVHRGITPDQFPVGFDFAGLWERRASLAIAGGRVQTPGPEDTFLILCVQLIKDAWGGGVLRLSKVCDIAELIRSSPGLDWNFVAAQARRAGCLRIVQVSLAVTERLLGALPSAQALRSHGDARRRPLEDHVIAKLFAASHESATRLMPRERFHFSMRERWRDKAYPHVRELLLRMRPNERDRAMVSLPPQLDFLYYLVRPVRLARDRFRAFVSPRS